MIENFFWTVSDHVRDLFQPVGKTELKITAYKENNSWFFNLPPITWKESLLFPEALNEIAEGKDKVDLTISSVWLNNAHEARLVGPDPMSVGSHFYKWKGHEIWLCPWNQWYFGEVHEKLWFRKGH
jgi:hypothetical protein